MRLVLATFLALSIPSAAAEEAGIVETVGMLIASVRTCAQVVDPAAIIGLVERTVPVDDAAYEPALNVAIAFNTARIGLMSKAGLEAHCRDMRALAAALNIGDEQRLVGLQLRPLKLFPPLPED